MKIRQIGIYLASKEAGNLIQLVAKHRNHQCAYREYESKAYLYLNPSSQSGSDMIMINPWH